MNGLHWSVSATACFALLAGCSSDADSNDQDPTAEVTPIEQLPAAYAAAVCEAYSACLGPIFEIYLGAEDCLTLTQERLEDSLPRFEAAIAAGRIEYHGELLETCVAELSGFSCDELLTRDTASCEQVLEGTLAAGTYCAMDEECQGTRYCQFDTRCPGTCAELEREGGSCEGDGNCDSGLICSKVTSRCVTPAGFGDPCQAGEPECAPGFLCAGADEDMNRSGNCRSYDEVFAVAAGESCDPIGGKLCAAGLVCRIDSVTPALEATCSSPAEAGAVCRLSFPDPCPQQQFCDIPPNMLDGTCKPRPAAGQACGATPFEAEGSVCAAYARCDGQTCRSLAHLSEACTNDDACYSERCVDGVCVASEGCE
jgi:hypothetical protein